MTFSSIPQTYGDLVLSIFAIPSATGKQMYIKLNNDAGSNYSFVYMKGSGSSATSASGTATDLQITEGVPFSSGSPYFLDIMDYSATDKHKTVLSRGNSADAYGVKAHAARWASSSAVTSITIPISSGTFEPGSTFHLYGIAKAL